MADDMKALVFVGPERLEIQDRPEPVPKADQVKIRVRACGICGSDVHGYAGLTGRRIAPMVMGHEFSGEIAEIGPEVRQFKVGDRVTAYPVETCGICVNCLAGNIQFCLNKRAYGVLDCDGALTEYLCVPERLLFKLENQIPFSLGALIEPLAVARHAIRSAGDLTGQTVLIIGAGTIGLMALSLVKLANPQKVIVTDLSDTRLKIAARMGADATVNPGQEPVETAILGLTNGLGADIAFECVGVSAAARQSIDCVKSKGTIIWIGNSVKQIEIDMQKVVTRELSIRGSFLYTMADFQDATALLNQGEVDLAPVISQEIRLAEAPGLFATLYTNPGDLIKVVVA